MALYGIVAVVLLYAFSTSLGYNELRRRVQRKAVGQLLECSGCNLVDIKIDDDDAPRHGVESCIPVCFVLPCTKRKDRCTAQVRTMVSFQRIVFTTCLPYSLYIISSVRRRIVVAIIRQRLPFKSSSTKRR